MKKKRSFKRGWLVLTVMALICLPSLQYFETIIFLNRTASMPVGLYKKIPSNKFEIGDIIVFYSANKKSNLLKYIAGYEGHEYCFDFEGTLWVNGLPLAKQNNIKYSHLPANQSSCQVLKKDEFLVLGEHPDSYDSRYFGPMEKQHIVALVELILQFKND